MNDFTEWSAITALSLLQSFNVFVLIEICEINGWWDIHLSKFIALSIYPFFGVINFIIFIRKRNYDNVIKQFSRVKPIDIIYPMLFYCYVISTIWLLFSITEQVRDLNSSKSEMQQLYQLPHN
jgi:hypothetical protein